MSAETLVIDLTELARAKFEESACCSSMANAFLHCIKLINHHLAVAAPDLSGTTSAKPAADPARANKKRNVGPLRSRIKDTIFDIVREHGDWIADADIAEEMTKRGIPFVKRMLMDRLGDAVRRGEFGSALQ